MHAQARAISLQPDAPMFHRDGGTDNVVSSAGSKAEPTRTRMHAEECSAEEWSAFAAPHEPTSSDTRLYRAWYAIARQEYHETLMCLQDCNRQTAISRSSPDGPVHLQDMIQRVAPLVAVHAQELRGAALYIMLHHRDTDTAASIQELMMRVLMHYAHKKLDEDIRASQKKDVPLEAKTVLHHRKTCHWRQGKGR